MCVSAFQEQQLGVMEVMEQQLFPVLPEWDEEGFPLALGGFGHAEQDQTDDESGEWVQKEVFVLRHLPQDASSCSSSRQRLFQDAIHIHWPLVERKQAFRGYAHNVLLRLNDDLARTQGGHHAQHSLFTVQHSDLEGLRTRTVFKIPPEILNGLPHETSSPSKTKIYHISIWKEFIYGPSVVMLERRCLTSRELNGIEPLTFRLGKFINRRIVDWSLYMSFFGICFLYCLIFHDLLELGLYLLYGSHLSIHLLAIGSNIEVVFSGSFFQGPAYAFIRLLCQHCAQEENAKVMRRHMAKMKRDIMNAEVT